MKRALTVHDRVLISHRKLRPEDGESLDFSNRMHGIAWYAGAIVLGLVLSALSGCGSGPKTNTPPARITCTKAADAAYVVSFFKLAGFTLSIAQVVDALDVAPLCAAPVAKAASS